MRKLDRKYDWGNLRKRDNPVPALQRIAKKYPTTKAGQRAAGLARQLERRK